MSESIDRLQIEISASSKNAVQGLESLERALVKIKTAAQGGLHLRTAINQIKQLNDSLSKIKVPQGLSEATSKIVKAIEPLKKIEKLSNLNSVRNSIKKIPEMLETLEKVDMTKFATQMERVREAIAPLASEMDKVAKGFSAFPSRIQRLITQNEKLTGSNRKLNKSYGVLGTGIKGVYVKFAAYYHTFRRVANLIGGFFAESSDYVEALNLFRVTMGDFADEAKEYGEAVQRLMGIDSKEWMNYQGAFQQILRGFGLAQEKALILSRNLSQVAYDLSSVWNVSVETAFQKLQSGMSGQIKGLKVWGINLSVAALQETALAHGIDKSVRSMSEADRAYLRYITIMEKTTNIQGDLGRTLITPANAMRILEEQVIQAKRALGQLVSVLIVKVIPYVQAFVELVREAAANLAILWGFELPDIDYSNLDTGLGNAEEDLDEMNESAKEFKKTILGIDELNLMADNNPIVTPEADGSVLGDLINNLPDNNEWLKGIENHVDDIKDKMREWVDLALKVGLIILGWKIAKSVLTFFANLTTSLPVLKTVFGTGVGGIAFAISAAFGEMQHSLFGGGGFFTSLGKGFTGFRNNLSTVNKMLVGAAGLVASFLITKNAAKEFAQDGLEFSMGSALKGLTGVALGAGAGFVIGGPVGALIGGLASIVEFMIVAQDEQDKLRFEMLKTDFYDQNCEKIDDVREALNNYFDSMDFDKHEEWIRTIENAEDSYDEARDAYDLMWLSIYNKPVFDASDVEGLSDAFHDLAKAANEVNRAKIDQLMRDIKRGIDANITDALVDKLGDLLGKVAEAKNILGAQISGISAKYQEKLDTIAKRKDKDGKIWLEAGERQELEQMRNEIAKYTLIDNSDKITWENQKEELKKRGINAGANYDAVVKNIEKLVEERDTYLYNLLKLKSTNEGTLKQLIEKDQELFGGVLGFDSSDLDLLDDVYKAQTKEVYKQYNDVLDAIINQYKKSLPDAVPDRNWFEIAAFVLERGRSIAFDGYDPLPDEKAAKKMREEGLKLIEKLKGYKQYASGGFPEQGELFIAREAGAELVGSLGNKTAVANNQQIEKGIENAVYRAMRASGGAGGGDWTIQVVDTNGNVRSTSIVSALDRANRRNGKTIVELGTT